MTLKIAIVVHGRFYAFDLARELIDQGHQVILLTNYPSSIVNRFGIKKQYIKSFLLHGILSRAAHRLHQLNIVPDCTPWINTAFSRWAAHVLKQYPVDVVHCFSGIAEELFQSLADVPTLKTLGRGSAHIQIQSQILIEEEKRANRKIDRPDDWIIAREKREYQLSDVIVVLSRFAHSSFLQQGIEDSRLHLLTLGAQLKLFRPEAEVIKDRIKRIQSHQRLRVLMVGNFSFQKGIIDLVRIADLGKSFCDIRFVGSSAAEADAKISGASESIEFIGRQPEYTLPTYYNWADIFIFTTLQDGYAVVLSQAQAAGLPILSTVNCAAPDIVCENETGWLFSIRSSEDFVEKLRWCDDHREELSRMVQRVYQEFQPRDWAGVASDFSALAMTASTPSEVHRPLASLF